MDALGRLVKKVLLAATILLFLTFAVVCVVRAVGDAGFRWDYLTLAMIDLAVAILVAAELWE